MLPRVYQHLSHAGQRLQLARDCRSLYELQACSEDRNQLHSEFANGVVSLARCGEL